MLLAYVLRSGLLAAATLFCCLLRRLHCTPRQRPDWTLPVMSTGGRAQALLRLWLPT